MHEAIDWMTQLKEFELVKGKKRTFFKKNLHRYSCKIFMQTWIEEPTSPDDVLGHAAISKALKKHG